MQDFRLCLKLTICENLSIHVPNLKNLGWSLTSKIKVSPNKRENSTSTIKVESYKVLIIFFFEE